MRFSQSCAVEWCWELELIQTYLELILAVEHGERSKSPATVTLALAVTAATRELGADSDPHSRGLDTVDTCVVKTCQNARNFAGNIRKQDQRLETSGLQVGGRQVQMKSPGLALPTRNPHEASKKWVRENYTKSFIWTTRHGWRKNSSLVRQRPRGTPLPSTPDHVEGEPLQEKRW